MAPRWCGSRGRSARRADDEVLALGETPGFTVLRVSVRKPKVSSCPKCGESDAGIPILYGLPSVEAMEASEREEIVLAGCMVGDVDPNRYCRRRLGYHGRMLVPGWKCISANGFRVT